jgi:Protein of unknown function (DUF2934)
MSSLGSGQKAADKQAESSTGSEAEQEPATTDRNDRIREIAYFMWLDEGSPDGEHERHWTTAEGLLVSEPEPREESESERRKRIEGEPPGEPVSGSRGSLRETPKAAE